jgi:hypothetical protein
MGLDTHGFFDSKYSTYGATLGLTPSGLPTINTPGEYQLLKYNAAVDTFNVDWWFPYPEEYSFWIQPEALSGTFDDPTNESLMIRGVKDNSSTPTSIFLQRSNLDGICLDFNTLSYYPISSNPALSSFSDFNSLPETTSFEFNAVLIYYDIIDTTTQETSTNLYGVLFLDSVQDTLSGSGSIPSLKKFKPNYISGLQGNSYGFKINVKFDVSSEQAVVVTSVNEYAPFSMQLFIDALNQIQGAADILTSQSLLVNSLSKKIDSLQNLVFNSTNLDSLDSRLKILESQVSNAGAALANSSTLIDLISRNYTEIQNIYNNKTSVAVSYNTNVIKNGKGILIDKSTPNSVIISNIEQSYTVNSSSLVKVTTDFTSTPSAWTYFPKLQPFGNYMKIDNNVNLTLDRDINIYIDDSSENWNAGQTYKLVIDHQYPMDMYTGGSFDLVLYTDSTDKLNTGQTYSKEIARITSADFYSNGGSPKIEILCIDPSNYTFTFDLL